MCVCACVCVVILYTVVLPGTQNGVPKEVSSIQRFVIEWFHCLSHIGSCEYELITFVFFVYCNNCT